MIGFTTVTFRKLEMKQIVALATQNAITTIEWGGDVHVNSLEQAKLARKICKEAGITISSYGSYFVVGETNEADFDSLCQTVYALGAPVMRVWLGNKSSTAYTEDKIAMLVKTTRMLADVAQTYGIIIAFEFHHNTLNDNGESCLQFLKQCGKNNVKTYWQPLYQGEDTNNLNLVLPFLLNVHVFYWNARGKRFLLKKGEKEWHPWITQLKQAGFTGNYLLEFCKHDNQKNFEKDIVTLKNWLK